MNQATADPSRASSTPANAEEEQTTRDTLRITLLDDWQPIICTGPDSQAFLHAQFTCDVVALTPPAWQWAGYCNPKGRLIAFIGILALAPDTYQLWLPAELVSGVAARLRKFVLRAKLSIDTPAKPPQLAGIMGSQHTPVQPIAAFTSPAVVYSQLPILRSVIVIDTGTHADIATQLNAELSPSAQWRALDIAAGIPQIYATNSERHLVQALNLDLIGAVSFNKGCYPGQEIVARTHYLGRIQRRMYRARLQTIHPLNPGQNLSVNGEPAGEIIAAQQIDPNTWEVLASLRLNFAHHAALKLDEDASSTINFMPLPYPVDSL